MRRAPFILACTVAVAAAACSGSSDVAQPTRTLPPPGSALIEPVTSSTTTPPPPCPQNPITVDAGKPEVNVTELGDPPTELQSNDITVGDGAEAASGDTVAMQYVGVAFSTGEEFDSSWSRDAEPFTFTLGKGEVIQGWDQGIVGMKVGGRRQLIIPPDLAYGEAGSPPAIGPNETLVFVVDLVEVCSAETPADATTGTEVPADGTATAGTEVPAGATEQTSTTNTAAG